MSKKFKTRTRVLSLQPEYNPNMTPNPHDQRDPTVLNLISVIQSLEMASTVSNGNDRSEKWQPPFQMATTVYERQIGFGEGDSLPNPVCAVAEPGAHTEN